MSSDRTKQICLWMTIYIYIYIPTPPHKQDVTLGRSLRRGLIGLNSDFSLSLASCHNKLKNHCLLLFSQSGSKNTWVYSFPKGIKAMWKMQTVSSKICSRVPCPFPLTVIIIPRTSYLCTKTRTHTHTHTHTHTPNVIYTFHAIDQRIVTIISDLESDTIVYSKK